MKSTSPLLACLAVAGITLAGEDQSLTSALTLHASFDSGFDAGFSKGSPSCRMRMGKETVPAKDTESVRQLPTGGKFGGALHFSRKDTICPQFDGTVLGYNTQNWSGSVSLWMKLAPDQDLEPGYCDPVQITGNDFKKGFIFLEWSKDERPRFFRYALRPLFPIWNPGNVPWNDIPFEKRPMVQVEGAPFSRERWTHTLFTFEGINSKTIPPKGKLYLNGTLQGTVEKWDLTFGWDPSSVLLVLGAAYVGYMDDLCVFNKALSDSEAKMLYELPTGGATLR
jgi:hypothetical protein